MESILNYEYRICVAGSRSWHDSPVFDIAVRAYLSWIRTCIEKAGRNERYAFISGDAWRGPDRMIIDWAKENGEKCFEFPADWDEYGKAAGHIRNGEMRKVLTHLLVFWDGESKGTKEMIDNTIKMGVNNVFLVSVKPDEWWLEYQRRKREKKAAAR